LIELIIFEYKGLSSPQINLVYYHRSIFGLITGLVETGGAPRATFLIGFNLEKTKYIATAAVIALGTDATRIPNKWYGTVRNKI
jgi:hypothetical protein